MPSVAVTRGSQTEPDISRVLRLTDEGKVVYRADKRGPQRFPDPARADLAAGTSRNFQVFDPLDFIAEVTQHVPNKGEHLVRYYGWYSNKSRLPAAGRGDAGEGGA